jgi:hypothetical protein
LTRFVDEIDERFVTRRIAEIYLRDTDNQSDIPNKKLRLNKVIALIAGDPDDTARRMLGSARYLLGEYTEAINVWKLSLDNKDKNDILERKQLLNNMAVGYTKLHQYVLAIQMAEAGVDLPFDVGSEPQRREQIRLLSTLATAHYYAQHCDAAVQVWQVRQNMKQQNLSQCTALLDAQFRACKISSERDNQLMSSLLIGVAQEPETFVDQTVEAITALVNQASIVFGECYLGLSFDSDKVLEAALVGVSSNQ